MGQPCEEQLQNRKRLDRIIHEIKGGKIKRIYEEADIEEIKPQKGWKCFRPTSTRTVTIRYKVAGREG